MRADDPRHGTYAGAVAHWKEGESPCEPCANAATRHRKQRRYLEHLGQPSTVPAVGTVRRVQALQALGWTFPKIAAAAGIPVRSLQNPLYRSTTVYRTTAEAVAAAYERLSMHLPPENTRQEKRDASYARTVARKNGWLPPLAWDDIDNPNEQPTTADIHRPKTDIDEAVVLRVLAGDRLAMTTGERREVVRRAIARGWSEREIEERTGITQATSKSRYGTEDAA